MKDCTYWVYIMTNKPYGTLYTGITNDIHYRVAEHKEGRGSTFTSRYRLYKLVYTEAFGGIEEAIKREKQIKKWRRQWKVELIEKQNPEWKDFARGW